MYYHNTTSLSLSLSLLSVVVIPCTSYHVSCIVNSQEWTALEVQVGMWAHGLRSSCVVGCGSAHYVWQTHAMWHANNDESTVICTSTRSHLSVNGRLLTGMAFDSL